MSGEQGERREARGARREERGASGQARGEEPSSTGLDPRTASALSYLAGPFSGGLILFAESTNRDVRFHAWQSVVALGGLGLAVMACYAIAFIALFVSATAVSLMLWAATAIWFLVVVVWALCLWKSMAGGRWKLPLAGDYAERLASATPRGRAAS